MELKFRDCCRIYIKPYPYKSLNQYVKMVTCPSNISIFTRMNGRQRLYLIHARLHSTLRLYRAINKPNDKLQPTSNDLLSYPLLIAQATSHLILNQINSISTFYTLKQRV